MPCKTASAPQTTRFDPCRNNQASLKRTPKSGFAFTSPPSSANLVQDTLRSNRNNPRSFAIVGQGRRPPFRHRAPNSRAPRPRPPMVGADWSSPHMPRPEGFPVRRRRRRRNSVRAGDRGLGPLLLGGRLLHSGGPGRRWAFRPAAAPTSTSVARAPEPGSFRTWPPWNERTSRPLSGSRLHGGPPCPRPSTGPCCPFSLSRNLLLHP